MRRLKEVAEEYRIGVELKDEEYTSRACPICRVVENHERITRELFKYNKHN